jgi:hypothetical protein
MQTVAWRQGHVDHLLLAKGMHVDLTEIGRRIARGRVANLYGAKVWPEFTAQAIHLYAKLTLPRQ